MVGVLSSSLHCTKGRSTRFYDYDLSQFVQQALETRRSCQKQQEVKVMPLLPPFYRLPKQRFIWCHIIIILEFKVQSLNAFEFVAALGLTKDSAFHVMGLHEDYAMLVVMLRNGKEV
jgi:hypothetical protein